MLNLIGDEELSRKEESDRYLRSHSFACLMMATVEEIVAAKHRNQSQPIRDPNLDHGDKAKEQQEEDDTVTLKFLDSLDDYLRLLESLSSSFRQGWLELASARHSMGATRVSSTLFDLKPHRPATRLLVTHDSEADHVIREPHFTLCKWAFSSEEMEDGEDVTQMNCSDLSTQDSDSSQSHEAQDENSESNGPNISSEKLVQKERHKSLAVFGALVSPRLRDAQFSFETALEKLVEIANARSSLIVALNQLQKDKE